MNCQDAQNLLHAFADGELDLLNDAAMEKHLQGCPSCRRTQQDHSALKSAFAKDALYFKAPAHLRARVRATLREASGDDAKPVNWSWRWLAVATSLALVVLALLSFVFVKSRPSADDLLAQEIVSAHVRSLMADHLTDVPSSDQHTVKPWFDGKLDFSPAVIDLTKQGFTLIGGRLDYVADRPVAALVYQRRQHRINLFIYPSADGADDASRVAVRQGYNLVRWRKAGMNYWAVSDLNLGELQEFAQAIQSP